MKIYLITIMKKPTSMILLKHTCNEICYTRHTRAEITLKSCVH